MRFSLVKAAIATFSLGTLFLGANSTPTASPGKLIPRARTAVPLLEDAPWGYTVNIKYDTSDMGMMYEICKGSVSCDKIGVDQPNFMVAVDAANNDGDQAAGKVKLRGIILGTWLHVTGLEVTQLNKIVYKTIQNDFVADRMDMAAQEMGSAVDARTGKVNITPSNARAFDLIMTSNPFGVGIAKMLDEYEGMQGRTVTSIDMVVKSTLSKELAFNLSPVAS
jgi:hypothetical protein